MVLALMANKSHLSFTFPLSFALFFSFLVRNLPLARYSCSEDYGFDLRNLSLWLFASPSPVLPLVPAPSSSTTRAIRTTP